MPTSQATSSLTSPENPNIHEKRAASVPTCAGCAVGDHELSAALCGSCPCPCHAVGVPAVVVTSLGYQMIARAAKARTVARFLHQGGLPSTDAERMTPVMWNHFHASLRAKGLLGPHSTPPSQETIARTIAELRKLEQLIPECGAARIRRVPEAA